eukprot:TRINITY_DN5178_c0_g1::TRINITY_DN5178_c0_g1_i1::g.29356::m.29356 TRINITY_DN5178_c0_g1::TRINITY_DN5178_c0_g1_i1::g.29356  ORF type:complete len:102 (-),score=-13.80,Lip_A_acyltrans/PF03279.8/0.026 TRINITY_DN5178_c0_g1_i1:680-985(-)
MHFHTHQHVLLILTMIPHGFRARRTGRTLLTKTMLRTMRAVIIIQPHISGWDVQGMLLGQKNRDLPARLSPHTPATLGHRHTSTQIRPYQTQTISPAQAQE